MWIVCIVEGGFHRARFIFALKLCEFAESRPDWEKIIGEQFTIIMPLLSTTKQFHEPHRCSFFDLFKWMIARFRSGKFKLLLVQRRKILYLHLSKIARTKVIKLWQCVWIDKWLKKNIQWHQGYKEIFIHSDSDTENVRNRSFSMCDVCVRFKLRKVYHLKKLKIIMLLFLIYITISENFFIF